MQCANESDEVQEFLVCECWITTLRRHGNTSRVERIAHCTPYLEELYQLGIGKNQTTPDGLFTLMRVECLASCGSAPMMQINDDFYERLTTEKIDAILNGLKSGTPLPMPRPEVDEWQWTNAS